MAGRGEVPPGGGQADPEEPGTGTEPLEQLEPLEASVREAASRLLQLRQLNQELAGKVRELEAHLAARAGGSAGAGGEPAQEAEWAEIRRRVEALARHLERLAASSAPS